MRASEKDRRLNVRLSARQKDLLRDAAALTGTSISGFVLAPAVERAQILVAAKDTTEIQDHVADSFIAWLDEPGRFLPDMKPLVAAEPFEHR